ncbi:MAG: dephospho-CoA kinase [Candidatus Latescibacteria bacterium]|nr:dephospho-CoA kinase [Candidatus Latescibacterota bacterium]
MLIGVTGGIGSGKSTLARLLAQRGAVLIDADRLGHQVLEDRSVVEALVAAFGAAIVGEGGQVLRRELGRLAFGSSEGFARLNRIVRPFLETLLWTEIGRAEGPARDQVVVVDAALIYEWEVAERFDLMVVVDAPEALRCQRAAARQGLSEEEVRRRMAWQLPAAEKVARAEVVVENTGPVAELELKADEIWQHIRTLQAQGKTADE